MSDQVQIKRSIKEQANNARTINSKDSEVKELGAFPTRLMRRSLGPGQLTSRDHMTALRSRDAHTSCAVSCFGCRSLLCISAFGGFVLQVFADTIFRFIVYITVLLLVFNSLLPITLHSIDPHISRMIAKGAQRRPQKKTIRNFEGVRDQGLRSRAKLLLHSFYFWNIHKHS